MKSIRGHIGRLSAEFAQKPLFGFLRDASIDPVCRLEFVPFLAHFVMSFSDLYRFFLVEPSPRDRYQELVNVHLSEDAHHWMWFLFDLGTLNLDPTLRFSDALRVLWGDATVKTRRLTYQICKMSGAMSSTETLVLVQCIEATGGVALGAVATAGRELELRTGRRLVYFGAHHAETEGDHTLEHTSVRESLDEVDLSDVERARCRAIVERTFGLFDDFVGEMFELTRSGQKF